MHRCLPVSDARPRSGRALEFRPRCGLSGPTNTLSGSSLLLILVVFAAVAFALTATQLGII